MGLLDLIPVNPLSPFIKAAQNPLNDIGYGLGSGRTFQEGLSNASQRSGQMAPYRQQEMQRQEELNQVAESKNATIQAMMDAGREDLANMAEAGYMAEAWKAFTQAQQPGGNLMNVGGHIYDPAEKSWISPPGGGADAPASVREWEHFNGLTPDQQAAYLRMKRSNPYLDIGTGFVQPDPVNPGQVAGGPIIKNNEQEAYDTAFGTAEGKAAAERIQQLPGLIAKSDNMLGTIDGILNDPALDASTGWLSFLQALPGTDQYRFGQRALQLQGQAFLQAFESLKGAGQITEVEGTKATQAIGRLSTAQRAEDYRAALEELKGIINAAKQRGISAAGGQPTMRPPGGQTSGGDIDSILGTYGL